MTDTRTTLRTAVKQQRKSLSAQQGEIAAEGLLEHLQSWFSLQGQTCDQMRDKKSSEQARVAGYLAIDGEIDVAPAMSWLRGLGKATYLPIVRSEQLGHLLFAPYNDSSEFSAGHYRIPEPVHLPAERLSAQALELVLVPLVAFDRQGNRLGMGGGYYDRTFSYRVTKTPNQAQRNASRKNQILLGVAHDFQLQSAVAVESWDVPLDAVITDRAFYTPKK